MHGHEQETHNLQLLLLWRPHGAKLWSHQSPPHPEPSCHPIDIKSQHVVITQIIIWWAKTITNLAHPNNTTTTNNKSILPNRSQKLPLRNHHAITITLYIHTYVTNILYHQSMSSPRKLQHHHCCYHASLHLFGHQMITPATSFTA
jgi:hypothetical protein